MTSEEFMRIALEEASLAFARGEVPVGAVVVLNQEVLSREGNRVEELQDATAHAEVLAIRTASQKLKNFRLTGAILYSTLEPCILCSGAIILSRIQKVIWGAKDPRHGGAGSLYSILGSPHPIHRVESEGGILGDLAAKLMQDFFKNRR